MLHRSLYAFYYLYADIDECLIRPSLCQHICANTDGGYTCDCREGYHLNANGSCDGMCIRMK